MATFLSGWRRSSAAETPPSRQSATPPPQMKPPGQVGNGENYPSFDSPDRGAASPILGVGDKHPKSDSNVRFDSLASALSEACDRDHGAATILGPTVRP